MSPVLPKQFPFGYGVRQSAPFNAPTKPPAFNPTNGPPRGLVTGGNRATSRVNYGTSSVRHQGPRGRRG